MTDTTQTTSGTAARARTKTKRQRILPFDDHVLELRREEPDLFRPYNVDAIADTLADRLFPDVDLPNRNVIKELMERVLGTFRRRFDEGFTAATRRTSKEVSVPKVVANEVASLVLGSFKSGTVMRDGRPLGEWTWGEFRQEFTGMADIFSKFAHMPDDALIGDTLN